MAHARVLSKLDDIEQIESLANKIIKDNINVRQLEEMASGKDIVKKNKIKTTKKTDEYKYVEDLMREKLDAKVKIKNKKIEITFVNNADLNRILEIIDIKGD